MGSSAELALSRDVVINFKLHKSQLALRKGISSTVVPNVFRFEESSRAQMIYSADLREELGIEPGRDLSSTYSCGSSEGY